MNVLFAIAEATPLYKIGGLGDVGGSLPKILFDLGVDVRLALPKHPEISISGPEWIQTATFSITYANKKLPVVVYTGTLPGSQVPVYLFEEKTYLSEHTDASDNHADKFTVFSLAVSTFVMQKNQYWRPHIIHLHDWHTALIPLILKHHFENTAIKTVITIHNLMYQGKTDSPVIARLGLPEEVCEPITWDKEDHHTNILMQGLIHADKITTVSPQYAEEIKTKEYGAGLEEIIIARENDTVGILNGLDLVFFDPKTDPFLFEKFSVDTYQAGKQANKKGVRELLGLPEVATPLIGFVGRVDRDQKGIDLIIEAIKDHQLIPEDHQFVFLGTGDPALETKLHELANAKPNIKVVTQFNEELAHRIYAASDVVLIPSRFEPCGLVQMIAMRYGALPIARATGGLKDTIIHEEDGFLFQAFDASAFSKTTNEALLMYNQKDRWHQLVTKAISKDFSWNKSAEEYATLYQNLLLKDE